MRNTSRERRALSLKLAVAADFADVFEVRRLAPPPSPTSTPFRDRDRPRRAASDGLSELGARPLRRARPPHPGRRGMGAVARRPASASPSRSRWLRRTARAAPHAPIAYETWRASFADLPPPQDAAAPCGRRPTGAAALHAPTGRCRRGRALVHAPPSAATPCSRRTCCSRTARTWRRGCCATSRGAEGAPWTQPRRGARPSWITRCGSAGCAHRAVFAARTFYGSVDATPLFLTLLDAPRGHRFAGPGARTAAA